MTIWTSTRTASRIVLSLNNQERRPTTCASTNPPGSSTLGCICSSWAGSACAKIICRSCSRCSGVSCELSMTLDSLGGFTISCRLSFGMWYSMSLQYKSMALAGLRLATRDSQPLTLGALASATAAIVARTSAVALFGTPLGRPLPALGGFGLLLATNLQTYWSVAMESRARHHVVRS